MSESSRDVINEILEAYEVVECSVLADIGEELTDDGWSIKRKPTGGMTMIIKLQRKTVRAKEI